AGRLVRGVHERAGVACHAVASDGLPPVRLRLLEPAAGVAVDVRRGHRRGRCAMSDAQYDVVIVGAGVAGSTSAKELGLAGKRVLILEAGLAVPDSREEYMENFYLALAKTPESPYPALAGRTGSQANPVGVLPDPSTLPTPRATVLAI